MIFDRIMLPAQGRNEDYKFAQTGTVTLAASTGGAGGAEPTPSWLENVIKLDPESGFLSVDDWHVKGDLIIEGQVNQWLAQQLVVDDARIQVNRRQEGAVVNSGLVIFDKDTSSEVSSLVYDVDGVWKAGGEAIATKPWVENSATAYNAARLGGVVAANYLRSDVVDQFKHLYTGYRWTSKTDGIQFGIDGINGGLAFYDGVNPYSAAIFRDTDEFFYVGVRSGETLRGIVLNKDGWAGFGIKPTERLHVAGNGLFSGSLTAGGNVSAPTFVSGFAGSGWRLEAGAENHLTVDRLTVRGRMDVYELVVNQIRGTNGALWVSDSAKVASVSGNRLTIDTGGDTSFVPFVVNDLLRCQRWNGKNIKYYVVRVTAVGSNYIDVALVAGSSPREAGDHLVRMGNTEDTDRQGALYLTSSDSNAPYMDVLDGVDSASFAGKTKVRIGRLDGITDPDLGTLSGYGLYTENGYFKGKIQVTGGNAATKADVDNIQIGGRNLIIRKTEVADTWIDASGNIVAQANHATSDFIPVTAVSYMFSREASVLISSAFFRWAWYDSNKVYIARQANSATSFAWTPPSGAAFVRISYPADCSPKFERGNKATDWTPAPEDVDAAIDNIAIGGRNLWKTSRTSPEQVEVTQYGYLDSGRLLSDVAIKAGQIVTFGLSVVDIPAGEAVMVRVDFYRPDQTYESLPYGNEVSGEGRSSITFVVPDLSEFVRVRFRVYPVGFTAAYNVKIYNEKLETGNRATDWTPAPEDVPSALDYLATAIQDGSTDIEGGLINTNVLMVKDTNGEVSGGISGLASDNVGFWTGGTYQDAINNNANVIFRKDGSISLAGGKIIGTSDGSLFIDGGVVTGLIESQNWDGENGSRLNLLDGSLEFGNTIKVDSFSKEIIVKDGDTQNTGVRIGDFLLSPTTGGAGALDVDLSGSRTLPAYPASSPQDPPFLLREGLTTYINSSGVIGSSSVTVSTNLTAGNNYTFQTSINARITRGEVLDTATDPIGAPSTIINSISRGGVLPWITVSLFSGGTMVGRRSFTIIEKSDLGVATFSDQALNINIPFTAASNSLRVEITQSGEVVWKVRYPASQGYLVEFRNAGLIYSELDAASRVRIIPSAAINELSAKGFLSLWGPEKYFRIYDRAGVTNFIEARGVQMFISPNGVHRLRVTDAGIQKSSNSGVSWTSL